VTWLLTSPLGRSLLAGIGLALLLGGATFWIYHKGQGDERNSNAGQVLAETEAERKAREASDAAARAQSDGDALKCLRNPQGC
jgi:hypothetical protein